MYLVQGHTKNACDWMFMLLKQHYHHKNLYTMDQLNTNLNQNNDVNAVEVKHPTFNDFDALLDRLYKQPESSLVACTHIFSMNHNKPGVLHMQDSTDSKV